MARRCCVSAAIHGGGRAPVDVQSSPFHDELRERTRLPVFTAAIVLLNVLMFFQMALADGSVSDPETLVAWGASVGPRTTHGEWWRLLTSLFVHGGLLHLLTDLIGLVMVACCWSGSPVLWQSAPSTWDRGSRKRRQPDRGSHGRQHRRFRCDLGVYGMFVAAGIWGLLQPSRMTFPLTVVKSLLPSAVIFLLYSLATGEVSGARAPHGLMMGLVSGLALTAGVGVRKPPALRSAIALVVTLVIGAVFAVPQRGYLDVKPEIARLMAFERRTADVYDKAVEQFKLGGINAGALAQVIDRTIRPELQSVRLRLKSLERVPERDHRLSPARKNTCGCAMRAGACEPRAYTRATCSHCGRPIAPREHRWTFSRPSRCPAISNLSRIGC